MFLEYTRGFEEGEVVSEKLLHLQSLQEQYASMGQSGFRNIMARANLWPDIGNVITAMNTLQQGQVKVKEAVESLNYIRGVIEWVPAGCVSSWTQAACRKLSSKEILDSLLADALQARDEDTRVEAEAVVREKEEVEKELEKQRDGLVLKVGWIRGHM